MHACAHAHTQRGERECVFYNSNNMKVGAFSQHNTTLVQVVFNCFSKAKIKTGGVLSDSNNVT